MSITGSTSRHCYVCSCSNGDYQLQIWKKKPCPTSEYHGSLNCKCQPPFRLFTFPTEKRDPDGRAAWLKSINRADPKKTHALLTPSPNHRVCSLHFVDGAPSKENPIPELHLGYQKKNSSSCKEREERSAKRRKFIGTEKCSEPSCEAVDEIKPKTDSHSPMKKSFFVLMKFILMVLFNIIRKLKQQLQNQKNQESKINVGIEKGKLSTQT